MKITKRQLMQIIAEEKRKINEETVGVEDVSQTADAFGGGDVEEEVFVDGDEDTLLNQNNDPGAAPAGTTMAERRNQLKARLRKIVKEQAGEGGGLPNPTDLAKKLSSAGPGAAMDFLSDLLNRVSFGAAGKPEETVEEPALPPELPPVDDVPPEGM